MLLIGLLLPPEGIDSSVHVMYLPLLKNIDKIGTYIWGSACLSYLYSSFCKNINKDTSTFYRYAIFL